MSDETKNPKFLESAAFSANLSIPEIEEINESYPLIMKVDTPIAPDHQFCTKKVFLFTCLRLATSNSIPKNSKAEDLEKIKALEAEVTRLANLVDEKQINLNQQIDLINALEQKNNFIESKLNELTQLEPEKVTVEKIIEKEKQLLDNQILITFSPIELDIIKLVTKQESDRVKKNITADIILRDMFNLFVSQGPSDFFRRPTYAQLKEIALKHKTT